MHGVWSSDNHLFCSASPPPFCSITVYCRETESEGEENSKRDGETGRAEGERVLGDAGDEAGASRRVVVGGGVGG